MPASPGFIRQNLSGILFGQVKMWANPDTFAAIMDAKERAFKKSLPDRRLSQARQSYLLSELIDKTQQEDLIRYARHLKPYLPLLAKIKSS